MKAADCFATLAVVDPRYAKKRPGRFLFRAEWFAGGTWFGEGDG
jgi:hypothetical protein